MKGGPVTDTTDRVFYAADDGLPPLAGSEHYIEIRMHVGYLPMGGGQVFVLSFDGRKWSSRVVVTDPHLFDISKKEKTIKQYPVFPLKPYEEIFSDLVEAGLFSLPSQAELKTGRYVDDGTYYLIACKVGSRFRMIKFNNPNEYHELFPKIKIFKQYIDLVAVFSKQFYRN
ncbi:hypothetical protein [Niabella drilacis]|nr:hypothetical protein [Niabella drilacis]